MARSADPDAAEEIWGTLEELLLAFAVSRHGTRSWDYVAREVRTRSPSADRFLFTPEGCRKRYHKLQCRFSAADGEIGVGGEGGDGSLQLKLKNLNEERERSFREREDGEPDLNHKKEGKDGESSRSGNVSDQISGEDSSRSSNSTNQKEKEAKPAAGFGETEVAPGAEDQIADPAAGADAKSAGEASCNGSSDTIAKAAAEANLPRPPGLGESGESVAESKGSEAEAEGEGAKETSDLQSSARPSRRPRRKVVSGSNGGNEPEADAVSPVGKRVAAESQPLIAFLEVIQAHKYGSVFERRLASQGSVRYRGLIRRHVDLEMVRAKMERRGCAEAYRSAEFFRDLLLLCYNAIVFYPKSSPESIAAVRLRGLVSKEMARTIRKPARPPKADEPTPPKHLLRPPPPSPPVSHFKSDPDRASQPLEKSISSGPFIACRKRRSLSGGVAGGATRGEEDKEKLRVLRKGREVDEYESPSKKRKKEGSAVSGPRGFGSTKTGRNAGNSGSGVSKSPSPISTSTTKSTAVKDSAETTAKSEKNDGGGETVSASKRKGMGASKRKGMGEMTPMSNGALPNTRRRSASSDGGNGAEQVKNVGRGDQRNRYSRQSSGAATSKRAAELSTPAKRSVGRPPKRAAAPRQAKKVKAEVGRKLRKRARG
ncbi:serine/arginine repetitive matrix protein 1 [Cocos nucifera]|uniref:Serine/arginine repetitive matrix protein 1 n=1 Tax=Cocos nucifera TaxID=13894 RepID=A0A8K0IPI4_COCNU|nr:serine/arginine repetitive matrix protein 1 [Cocos nucifera]